MTTGATPRLALTYARRELRAGLSGLYVFMACLMLGVGAIAAIQSLSLGLMDSLRHDGRYILGGDIAVSSLYKPVDDKALAYLKTLGAVSDTVSVSAMAQSTGPQENAAGAKDATLTDLKAVDNAYPLYGAYVLQNGDSLDAPQLAALLKTDAATGLPGALADDGVMSRLHIAVGDTIKIGTQSFVIKGAVAKEPDRLSSSGYIIAPRVLIARDMLEKTGLVVTGSRLTYTSRLALDAAKTAVLDPRALGKIERDFAKKFPDAAKHMQDCYNPSGTINRLVTRLTFFLTLIGLTTLLVGGVGISNAVRGFLDTKLSHIATLKSLGAPGGFVRQVYIFLILMLAGIGIVGGLALGAAGAIIGGSFVTAKLSLADSTGIYPAALGIAALFGFLTTLAFSLWPIGRAVSVTPADLFRDAILPAKGKPTLDIIAGSVLAAMMLAELAVITASDRHFAAYFVIGAGITFGVFFACAGLLKTLLKRVQQSAARRLSPEMRMAMANLHRPGNVTTGVILSLGLGLTVLIAIAQVEYNFSRLLSEDGVKDAPSFFFLDLQKQDRDNFTALMNSYHGTRKLLMTPSFRGRIVAVNGTDTMKALVDPSKRWVASADRGFTFTDEFPQYSHITAGKWWDKGYKGPPLVSIAEDVARAFNIGVGDHLTINILGMDITATVASVREVDWTSFTLNFAITFAPGVLDDAPYSLIATIIAPDAEQEAMQNAVAQKFPGITIIRVKDMLQTAGVFVTAVAQAIRVSAIVTLIAGILVLAGGVAAARRRHVYDAVILKVLGATRGRILKTFLLEYGFLGMMTVFIAGGLGTLASYAMLHFILELHWEFSLPSLVQVTVLSLGITLAAGFFGTWRALRQKPAPYLRSP